MLQELIGITEFYPSHYFLLAPSNLFDPPVCLFVLSPHFQIFLIPFPFQPQEDLGELLHVL